MRRRELLARAATGSLLLPRASDAFENSLPLPESKTGAYENRKPGPAPADIGIQKETGTLKPCLDTKPHCFSTASIVDYDEFIYDAGVGDPGLMQAWTFKKSRAEAMQDVVRAVKAYPPGQSDVDGGGWKIIKEEPNYVYVQYESLLKGFRDDMEFAITTDGVLSLRTSSRIGRQDMFVNSKRVNWYAQTLGAVDGWTTKPVSQETHPIYWTENGVPQSRNADLRKLREAGGGL